MLSVAYRVQIDPYGWTLLLGVITLAISAWLLSRLADRLLPNRSGVSWLVGLACVLEWHLIWAAASGMETLLFIALALALIDRLWAEFVGLDHRRAGRPADSDASRRTAVVRAGVGRDVDSFGPRRIDRGGEGRRRISHRAGSRRVLQSAGQRIDLSQYVLRQAKRIWRVDEHTADLAELDW